MLMNKCVKGVLLAAGYILGAAAFVASLPAKIHTLTTSHGVTADVVNCHGGI